MAILDIYDKENSIPYKSEEISEEHILRERLPVNKRSLDFIK